MKLLATAAVVVLAAGCGGDRTIVVGAGSTLVAPLVAQWVQAYGNATVTYSAIGSGGGLAQADERTIDIGASDAPLPPSARSTLVQIPWARGATVVAVNLPGGHPRLTGDDLAAIYLGKVRYWDEIAAGLPHLRIAPIHRSDSSGDTFVFTRYLARTSAAWRARVGDGTDVDWPVGSGAKGNAGMTAVLQQTPGAIAYVGIAQAKAAGLNHALLRNDAGNYPEPSAARRYPLSTYTYAIVDRSSKKLAALKAFLRYAVTDGQSFARDVSFAPLPARVRNADLKLIDGL